MAKFVYVGDPTPNKKTGAANGPTRENECTFVNALSAQKERVTFKAGEPKEAPEWLEKRLEKNTHFRRVDEKGKADK